MTTTDLPAFIRENYEIHEWRHACAIDVGESQARFVCEITQAIIEQKGK